MNFLFYFFYRIFKTYDDDPAFTAIISSFLVVCLYLLSTHTILHKLGYVSELPIFSHTYLYNKLYWYGPISIVFGIVYLFFSKKKRGAIIKMFDEVEDFFSFRSILIFTLVVALPIFIITYL